MNRPTILPRTSAVAAQAEGSAETEDLSTGAIRYVVVLAMVVVGLTFGWEASPAFAATKPTTNTSYYISTSSTAKAYSDGCAQGQKDSPKGAVSTRVVIAFGSQRSDFAGNYLPSTEAYISNANLKSVAEQFAEGYYACTGSNTSAVMYLGLSTNNSGSTINTAAGTAWGNVVKAVQSWVASNQTTSQVIIEGANDIEPTWASYSGSLDWVQGFEGAFNGLYMNTASTDGCSQSESDTSDSGCNNGWTRHDVYRLSWGESAALAVPQIYYLSQAKQWEGVSHYGTVHEPNGKILFTAPLDEYPSAHSTYTSTDAWNALLGELNNYSVTNMTPLWSMEVIYE